MCLVSPLHKLLQIVSFLLDSFIELKSQGRHEGVKHTLIHVYFFLILVVSSENLHSLKIQNVGFPEAQKYP